MGIEYVIKVDDKTPIYPGSFVRGAVCIRNDQQFICEGFYVRLEGKAKTEIKTTKTIQVAPPPQDPNNPQGQINQQNNPQQQQSQGQFGQQPVTGFGQGQGQGSNAGMTGSNDPAQQQPPPPPPQPTTKEIEVILSDKENYFDETIFLAGPRIWDHRSQVQILPGYTEHPFQFTLPNNCPASFKGEKGSVTYELTTEMAMYGSPNLKSNLMLTVNGILDLNKEQGVQGFTTLEKHGTICCCKSGTIGYTIKNLPKAAAIGEFISFDAEFVNGAKKETAETSIAIIENVKYTAEGQTSASSKSVASIVGPPVKPGATITWEGDNLKIPQIPVSKLGGNLKCISLSYCLHITMKLDSIHFTSEAPFVIGSIPLQKSK